MRRIWDVRGSGCTRQTPFEGQAAEYRGVGGEQCTPLLSQTGDGSLTPVASVFFSLQSKTASRVIWGKISLKGVIFQIKHFEQ